MRGASRKRQKENLILDQDDVEENDDGPHGPLHANGYEKDDFVISDGEASEDDFEPMRPLPKRRQQTLEELGGPISRDSRLAEANIDPIHADIIPFFVEEAKRREEQLRNKKGLRRAIFTERHFREMAIGWTSTLERMGRIPGISADNVDQFGAAFVPLIERFHAQYRDMMGSDIGSDNRQHETGGRSTHHVVDLVSSDEDDGLFVDQFDEEEELEASKYFGPPAPAPAPASAPQPREVQQWHDQLASLAQTAQPSRNRSGGGGGGGGGSGKGSSWKSGKRTFGRRASGARVGFPRDRSGGVTKRKASTARKSSSTSAKSGGSKASRGAGGIKGTGGGSGIDLMPV